MLIFDRAKTTDMGHRLSNIPVEESITDVNKVSEVLEWRP